MIKHIKHIFRGPHTARRSTNTIVIHHSDSHDVPAAEIHRWHMQKTNPVWNGIGYHYVIRANGTIETGRPHNVIGAHAGATINATSIGICLTGRFMQHLPTNAQMEALAWLIEYLEEKYGSLEIGGHNDFSNTNCPGVLFSWTDLWRKLEDINMTQQNIPASWAQADWDWAIAEGLLDGTRPLDTLTRQELAVILRRFDRRGCSCKVNLLQ